MRILAVNHEFPPLGGGGANANYYLAREVVRLGHHVTVITAHARGLAPVERLEGVEVIRLRCLRRHANHSTLAESACWVARALPFAVKWARANRPDIVLAFFALPNGPVAWAASRAARCPLVIRLGGGDVPGNDATRYTAAHRMLMPMTREIMRSAAAVIVNSEGLRRKAVAAFPDLAFEVIPNGVDLEKFAPTSDGQHGGPVRLLFVSRLIERKGLQYLIPVLGRLRRDGREFHLRIVGDGPMRDEVERLVAQEGIADLVQMDGNVPHEELSRAYREADVFTLPSLSEGMPNVVLEAAASGLPIVGTRVAGTEELVKEGQNGWLAAPGDAAGLERSVRAALAGKARLRRMGQVSRRMVSEMSWSAVARAYCDMWEHLVEGAPARHETAGVPAYHE